MKLVIPVKIKDMLFCARIEPQCCLAELLKKLFVPLKVSTALSFVLIAPPFPAELLMKLLFPLKLNTVLSSGESAPPCRSAKLLKKVLVPLKVSTTL